MHHNFGHAESLVASAMRAGDRDKPTPRSNVAVFLLRRQWHAHNSSTVLAWDAYRVGLQHCVRCK